MGMTEYYAVMRKLEKGEEPEPEEKYGAISLILMMRLDVDIRSDDPLIRELAEKVGRWSDYPMPIAAQDIPDMIEDFYRLGKPGH